MGLFRRQVSLKLSQSFPRYSRRTMQSVLMEPMIGMFKLMAADILKLELARVLRWILRHW
jgi:hypothetical protein